MSVSLILCLVTSLPEGAIRTQLQVGVVALVLRETKARKKYLFTQACSGKSRTEEAGEGQSLRRRIKLFRPPRKVLVLKRVSTEH